MILYDQEITQSWWCRCGSSVCKDERECQSHFGNFVLRLISADAASARNWLIRKLPSVLIFVRNIAAYEPLGNSLPRRLIFIKVIRDT